MASKGFQHASARETAPALNAVRFAHAPGVAEYGKGAAYLNSIYTNKTLETTTAPGSDQLLWAVLHAFDVLGIGWIVCDSNSVVLGVNQTAEVVLRNRDGLELDGEGRLRSVFTESASLGNAVTRVLGTGNSCQSEAKDITLSIARGGKCPLTILVHSVMRTMQNGSERPLALLLTLDSSVYTVSPVELQNLFRLTPQESRFAVLIMEGRTLEGCCSELEIDIPTGRFHLRELYRKTRSHHQGDLVLALFRQIAIVHLPTIAYET